MPSFDIVSKVDLQLLDNAVNTAKREILNRYDFHDSKSTVDLDKKEISICIITESEMRIKAIIESIISRMMRQGLDPACLDSNKAHYASGNMIRKDIKIKQGIDKETSKKIIKVIKDTGLKVQPSIIDEQIRINGKKIDELQKIIAVVKQNKFGLPLQYINMRS